MAKPWATPRFDLHAEPIGPDLRKGLTKALPNAVSIGAFRRDGAIRVRLTEPARAGRGGELRAGLPVILARPSLLPHARLGHSGEHGAMEVAPIIVHPPHGSGGRRVVAQADPRPRLHGRRRHRIPAPCLPAGCGGAARQSVVGEVARRQGAPLPSSLRRGGAAGFEPASSRFWRPRASTTALRPPPGAYRPSGGESALDPDSPAFKSARMPTPRRPEQQAGPPTR